ncbi:uncharacterized protein LOC126842313 isoform X2 [Adelges cooleyi]|uniref:uncharacterized protein LOC126842313 isoform X2 n=1 Tax=Adelges cooleyi TaxID=133065 RepID=UPI00217F2F86|nr:uncharacterized protein LOC126842313 isoform X2 [Adelges cooleyi]
MIMKGFPIVFALMSRKTTSAYNKIISFLKQLEPAWNPNTVMSDFERAIIRSFEEHFQEDFFMYYRRFWINEIGPVTLSEHGRTDRTNNILEASHRNLMSHFTHSNPSPWSFVERLLPYIGAITKDIRRARDGIEIHRDQPVIWQQQNNKILRAQRQLGMGQLTIFEFLVRCIHTTPQFGVPAPIQNDEHDIPEVVNHENNAADLQIDNQDFDIDDN